MLQVHIQVVLERLHYLKWRTNFEKSVTIPCKNLVFLGVLWNLWLNERSLPHEKMSDLKQKVSDLSHKGTTTLKSLQSLVGTLNFASFAVHVNAVCPWGQTAFSRHADVSKQDSERNTSQHLQSTRRGKRRVEMVASKVTSGLSDSLPTTFTLSDHRRIGHSVRCSARQPLTVGTVDNTRTEPLLQPKRNDRNTENFRAVRSALVQVNSFDTVRQQNGCSILTKRGRNQILTLDADPKRFFTFLLPPDPSKNPIYSGQIQKPCRSPFTSSASPKMASTPSMYNESFQKFGVPMIDLFASERAKVVIN